jgi:predicted esterase
MKSAGEFATDANIVLHPYGRYCNATKFAGEVDVFEALEAAARAYPVDRSRLVNAGFSMGGASAWHLGVHHSGLWAVTHTGAGFAETAEYAGVFAPGKTPPPWWEVILYRWYDATVAVANFANHPVLAYHGSEDKQTHATVVMNRYAEKEGVKIEEFIGPGVGHKYEPETKKKIAERISALLDQVKTNTPRKKITMSIHSLIYPNCEWLTVLGMERQWERGDVKAEAGDDEMFRVTTKNISALAIDPPWQWRERKFKKIIIDGQTLGWDSTDALWFLIDGNAPGKPATPRACILVKHDGKWATIEATKFKMRNKTRYLSGPIDHAFIPRLGSMNNPYEDVIPSDSTTFVFVKPTGAPLNSKLGEWTQRELAHATKQWRAIFRGDAPSVDDAKLTDAQIKDSNLILWGDPSSNAVLKKIADKLPVKWTKDGLELPLTSKNEVSGLLRFGGKKYDAATHLPILIFPNPLNPRRYVVLNSGFTFSRACASGTNSLQTPKLPDWAIVDTTVPPDDKFPGKIVDAGFFDEQWRFTTERPK